MYLSVDVGGTKTLIALFSEHGRVLRRRKFQTAYGSRTFIRDLTSALEEFRHRRLKSVVVAVPGIVHKNCSVSFGNRNWGDIDIYTPIKNLFNCEVFLENDASLAALYEGRGLPGKVIFLTFSTGIGGGIVSDDKILPESSKFEPGHRKYLFHGKMLEWEDIASGHALANAYHVERIERTTFLRNKSALEDIARRIGLGLPDVIREHKPDTIILGGPLGKVFGLYRRFLPDDLGVELRRPKRPHESVIYGCYLFAKEREG